MTLHAHIIAALVKNNHRIATGKVPCMTEPQFNIIGYEGYELHYNIKCMLLSHLMKETQETQIYLNNINLF